VKVGSEYGFDRDESPGRSLAVVKAVRDVMGDDFQLMVDANSCFSAPRAIELGRRYEQLGVFHFEEPCPYSDLDATAKVARALDLAVAGGEQDWDLQVFKAMLVKQAVDIVQPDVIKCYGFSHAKKIAALAEAFNTPVTLHNAKPHLGTVATLHFAASTPACRYAQEYSIEPYPFRDQLFEPRLEVVSGHIEVPKGPGLGVVLNEDLIKKNRVG
jgi:L-alanine-DL-glutamate epimerase-like enolase superfamily enzyme